jgi:hypothetical protein
LFFSCRLRMILKSSPTRRGKSVRHTPRVPMQDSPGTHARKDEDGLLLEFPCNPTRTCTV